MRVIFLLIGCFLVAVAGAQTITVYFDFNSFMLNNESKATLNSLVAKGKLRAVGFFGHTDQMGTVEYNDWLSVQRALAVKDYLLSKGLPQTEISVVRGFGADRLISDEQDETSRQLNRRVSISMGYKPTPTDLAIAEKQTPTYYTPSPNLASTIITTPSVGKAEESTAAVDKTVVVKEPSASVSEKKVLAESATTANTSSPPRTESSQTNTGENSFANRLSKTVNKGSSNTSGPPANGPVVKQQKSDKLIEDIQDKTTKEGEHIILKNIYFSGGRHSFLAKSYSALDDLLETMQKVPTLVVEIQGHVCCHEGDGDEIDFDSGLPVLSVTRAKAVYDFLIENGIDKKRITYKGLAHKFPLIKIEKSEEDAELNRRVEIKIVKK